MPNSRRPPSRQHHTGTTLGLTERRYIYWLFSTALLALALIVLVVYVRGVLARHAQTVDALNARVASLEATIQVLQERPTPAEPLATWLPPAPPTAPVEPPRDNRGSEQLQETLTEPNVSLNPVPDAAIRARIEQVAGPAPTSPADIQDGQAAAALVDDALTQLSRSDWGAATWARLATIARLLGRSTDAETLAARAIDGGAALITYTEVSVRALLAQGHPRDALVHANRLAAQTDNAPVARLLRAAALLANGQPGDTDRALAGIADIRAFPASDALLAARLWWTLERWPQLNAALAVVHDLPADLRPEYDFLYACSLARSADYVKALAMLDYLAAHPAVTLPDGTAATGLSAGPTRYEVDTWRGVTLMLASRVAPGREMLLQAAEQAPARPEAYYYLGLLEAGAGNPDRARSYLENALACSDRMAPAWEALAHLEFNAGNAPAALEHLDQALKIDDRRASTYFLRALTQAGLADRDEAANALAQAFQLDHRYLVEAKQADLIRELFTDTELDQLAEAAIPPIDPSTPQ